MRLVTHSIDPTVEEERIIAAVESRRRRFEMGSSTWIPQFSWRWDRLRSRRHPDCNCIRCGGGRRRELVAIADTYASRRHDFFLPGGIS
jgi:hypothetical protein